MSYNPLAYPFPSASSIMATQLLMNASQAAAAAAAARYESSGKAAPSDESGHCLCPATPGAAAAAAAAASAGFLSVPRMPTLPEFSAAAAAAAAAAQGYLPHFGGADPAAFYNVLSQAGGYAPCDPSTFQHYSPYCAPGYPGVDIAGVRRKNATRETTSQLKAWLYEHRKNPYPTKGEKIMLAIITKMTLTQVSTWFANVRRRLKKENKMTWSPKNRSADGSAAGGSLKSDDDEADETATEAAPELANAADGDIDIESSDPDESNDAIDARRGSAVLCGGAEESDGDDRCDGDTPSGVPSDNSRGIGSAASAVAASQANPAEGTSFREASVGGLDDQLKCRPRSSLPAQILRPSAIAARAKGAEAPQRGDSGCSSGASASATAVPAAAPSKPRIWSLADVATSCDSNRSSSSRSSGPSGAHRPRPYEDLRSSWPYYPAAHAHLPSTPPGAPLPLSLRLSPLSSSAATTATPCRPPPRLPPYAAVAAAATAVDGLARPSLTLQPPPSRPLAVDLRGPTIGIPGRSGSSEAGAVVRHRGSSAPSA